MASIDPTVQAAIARGSRKRQINSPCGLRGFWIAANHSDQVNDTEPVALAKNILPTDNSSMMKSNDRRNVIGIILQID